MCYFCVFQEDAASLAAPTARRSRHTSQPPTPTPMETNNIKVINAEISVRRMIKTNDYNDSNDMIIIILMIIIMIIIIVIIMINNTK